MAHDSAAAVEDHPAPSLSVLDAAAITIGVVVGIGIFKTPAMVAGSAGSEAAFYLLWLAGGAISLVGALCYAELAAANPNAGGEYQFLSRAFGRNLGFLFAWGRITVIQTGAIAAVAFVFGDYVSQLLPLGAYGASLYAVLAVAALTAVNMRGVTGGRWIQLVFTAATVLALAAIVLAAMIHGPGDAAPSAPAHPAGAIGLAMIFVLLTYGGWNEAAYLSAEVRDVQRNMVRFLALGIGVITALYLLLNFAYVQVLGLPAMRGSDVVAADLMRQTFGPGSAVLLSLVIAVAAVSTLNATIFTGARTSYAVGRDFPGLGFLGHWNGGGRTPSRALLVQGLVAVLLVVLGTFTRSGFVTMVEFTAPVFWLFFLLSGVSLFVLRAREPGRRLPFRVPLYPVTPLVFCATCAYMLYASLAYTGVGALFGAGVLAAGVPVLLWLRRRNGAAEARPT